MSCWISCASRVTRNVILGGTAGAAVVRVVSASEDEVEAVTGSAGVGEEGRVVFGEEVPVIVVGDVERAATNMPKDVADSPAARWRRVNSNSILLLGA